LEKEKEVKRKRVLIKTIEEKEITTDKDVNIFISMKNISKQYQDLLEGKISKDNFVRNCRQQFPQFVSPVTSVDDAIKILKSKRIIAESISKNTDYKDPYVKGYVDNENGFSIEDCPYNEPTEAGLWKDGWLDYETEKQMAHDEETYRRETGDIDYEMPRMESLNEATEKSTGNWEKTTGKQRYDMFRDIDRVNYSVFLKAVAFEASRQEDMSDEMLPAIMEKIAKKMIKDPNAYRELIIANYAEIAKKDEALKMVPVNGKNHVDEDNSMEKIKGQETPKATPSKKENRKGKPAGVKEMGITPKKAKGITAVMDMPGKEKVIASLKESIKKNISEDVHYKYSPGMQVHTADGEGKVTEIRGGTVTVEFSNGKQQDYQVNTLDHFGEKAKQKTEDSMKKEGFRDGVDLGASFDKFKGSMAAEDEFTAIMQNYDWYYEMSDDPRVYDRGVAKDEQLKALAKKIGPDVAIQIYNKFAPKDRKGSQSLFMEKKDKHTKLKEYLKKALKEKLSATVAKGSTDAQKAVAIDKALAAAKAPKGTPVDVIEK
jgi:ribosome modulation factor